MPIVGCWASCPSQAGLQQPAPLPVLVSLWPAQRHFTPVYMTPCILCSRAHTTPCGLVRSHATPAHPRAGCLPRCHNRACYLAPERFFDLPSKVDSAVLAPFGARAFKACDDATLRHKQQGARWLRGGGDNSAEDEAPHCIVDSAVRRRRRSPVPEEEEEVAVVAFGVDLSREAGRWRG